MKSLINVMKTDTKLHRFKQLMSYSLAASPALIVPAISYYLYKNTESFGAGEFLFVSMGNIINLGATIYFKIDESERYNGGLNILKHSFWYNTLNKPAQKIVQFLEKKLIQDIKNNDHSNNITSLYIEYASNQKLIKDWYNHTINSGRSKRYQRDDFALNDTYQDEYNKKFKFSQILNYLTKHKITTSDIDKIVESSFSHLDFSIKNGAYDAQRIELLLKTGKYTLTENDYKGIATVFQKEDISLLSLIFNNSSNNIDWDRLYLIFKNNYPNLDYKYEDFQAQFEAMIKKQDPQKENTKILTSIQNIRDKRKSTFTLDQAIYYTPNYFPETWQQLVKQCSIISKNDFLLTIEEKTNFQEQIKHTLPSIIQLDTYLVSVDLKEKKPEMLMKKMKTSLNALLSLSNELVENIENNLEKNIDIAAKISKPQQMHANK